MDVIDFFTGLMYVLLGVVGVICIVIEFIMMLLPVIIPFVIIRLIVKKRANNRFFKNNVVIHNADYDPKYKDVPKSKLAAFDIDSIDVIKDYLFQEFVDFEYAYNNLDFSVMQSLSTPELFEKYYTGIKLNQYSGKKRIISDIQKNKVYLFELDSTNVKIIASLMVDITYKNYVVDRNGEITSGIRFEPITEKFEITFRKNLQKTIVTNCSNCGAVINENSNTCDYCGTKISYDNEFKICAIKRIIN